MTKTEPSLVGPLLQYFFLQHMCSQKGASPETIASYRDTFRLLLQFIHTTQGINPTDLKVIDLNVPLILSFLEHIEQSRKNSVRSRNLRLAAIRSFFRVVALRDPPNVDLSSRILAIPRKRGDKHLVKCLTREEIDAILSCPNLDTFQGQRDHALLLTLYNSGARASEITALEKSQVHFGLNSFLYLHGKGRKERAIPLWLKTVNALRSWFDQSSDYKESKLAFPNSEGGKLTRNGLNYILQKAVSSAAPKLPSLQQRSITPHMIRHSTATHLLQSGVDIAVIALWLGHERLETTHIYVEADLATKERALSKLTPAGSDMPRFKASDKVLAFLKSL